RAEFTLQESLGAELVGLRIKIGAAVNEMAAGTKQDAGRIRAAGSRERLLGEPDDNGDDGADAQTLPNGGVEVAKLWDVLFQQLAAGRDRPDFFADFFYDI